MKILVLNRHHYMRGGDCRYSFNLMDLLEENGHKIVHFAMKHPENLDSPYSKYFTPYIDLQEELQEADFF